MKHVRSHHRKGAQSAINVICFVKSIIVILRGSPKAAKTVSKRLQNSQSSNVIFKEIDYIKSSGKLEFDCVRKIIAPLRFDV